MISLVFRIALIVCSILTTVFMIKKIRNSKLQIEHAIFWLMFAFLLIVISLFPQLTIWGAKLLGIYSSTNFTDFFSEIGCNCDDNTNIFTLFALSFLSREIFVSSFIESGTLSIPIITPFSSYIAAYT